MPTIPPIDPEFVDKVGKLTDEARATLQQVADLAERIGKVTQRYDEITDGLEDDAILDHVREVTGYDRLLDTMFELSAHAAAGADDNPSMTELPEWYQEQRARRRARWAVA